LKFYKPKVQRFKNIIFDFKESFEGFATLLSFKDNFTNENRPNTFNPIPAGGGGNLTPPL